MTSLPPIAEENTGGASEPGTELSKQEKEMIENDLRVEMGDQKHSKGLIEPVASAGAEGEPDYSSYYCSYVKPSFRQQVITMSLLGVMFLLGIFIMISGLISVVERINKS